MASLRYSVQFPVLSASDLDAWRQIPPAVASDCMNRRQVMAAAIKPIVPGLEICGQARTVTSMVGDCGLITIACAEALPGEIVVVDAGGDENTAVFGGVMTEAAKARGLGGVVIDGAVRDVSDIRAANFPIFCRSVVARGPHEGFGGTMDGTVAVGGVSVSPGDIIRGTDDGVVVVPLAQAARVLVAAQAHLKKEENWIKEIRSGRSLPEIFAMAPPQPIEDKARLG